jgi:hypothetical protein
MTTINTRQSDSYLGTFDVSSEKDMEQLAYLRDMVRSMNKMLKRETGKTFRICVRGRAPKAKMVAKDGYFFVASRKPVSYNFGGNIVGGLANATKLDAYIYTR